MLFEFEVEEVEIVTYPKGEHPLEHYVQGDADTRKEVILDHPDVIGYIYLNEDGIKKYSFPKKW